MRKRIAGVALAASLLAAVPVAPAQAEDLTCRPPLVPDGAVCLVTCLARWTVDFVFSGGTNPGYGCADA